MEAEDNDWDKKKGGCGKFDIINSMCYTLTSSKKTIYNWNIEKGKLSVRVGHKTIGPTRNSGSQLPITTKICAYSALVE